MDLHSFRRHLPFFLMLGLLGAVQVLQFGCAGKSVEDNDPAALFKEANEDISSDHFDMAIDKLKTIKNKFPYSKYAVDASLRLADVYFLQEDFIEAALAYQSFHDLHPSNSKVPYAMFRIGLSYFNDAPGNVSRDLSSDQKAEDAFNDFLVHFPSDPNATEARKDLGLAREALAEKELYIGNFYYIRDYYDSARGRYEALLSQYPDTPAAKEARKKLDKIEKENLHNED